jgi:hypothetical protein
MFSFLKRNRKKPLDSWRIPIDDDFRKIINRDSVQFVKSDQNIVLYFSTLTMSNGDLLTGEVFTKMQPTITRSEYGWEFKGAKQAGKEVLVCAFSFRNDDDKDLMKGLFEGIEYVGK